MELLARTRGQEGGGILLGHPRDLRVPDLDTVFVCGLSQPRRRASTPCSRNPSARLSCRLAASGRQAHLASGAIFRPRPAITSMWR